MFCRGLVEHADVLQGGPDEPDVQREHGAEPHPQQEEHHHDARRGVLGVRRVMVNFWSELRLSSFRHRVLRQNGGIELGLGMINFELAGCLVLAWISVYLIIYKGLHSSGKVTLRS